MLNIFASEMEQMRAIWKREETYHIILQLATSLLERSMKILEQEF